MPLSKINFPNLTEDLNRDHKEIIWFLQQITLDKSNTDKIYSTMLEYVTDHFKKEELYMIHMHLPLDLLNEHVKSHYKIREMFLNNMTGFVSKSEEEIEQSIEVLRYCFISHINSYDNTLANWVSRHGKESPNDIT